MSYERSAEVYDAIYVGRKNYVEEARIVTELIGRHTRRPARTLLDVGCGTGLHTAELAKDFDVEGVDLSPEMLAHARRRLPEITFHTRDMRSLGLGRRFDAVVSLFSAIGHLTSATDIHLAIASMSAHLAPGGVLLVEPWFLADRWEPRPMETNFLPEKRVLRVVESRREGQLAILDMHYFVNFPECVEYFFTEHRLGLHPADVFVKAFEHAELQVRFDEVGLTGRGLFVGTKHSDAG